jgi:hypothetical protein
MDGVDETKLQLESLDDNMLRKLEELRQASSAAKQQEESLLSEYQDDLDICIGELAMLVEQLAQMEATITLSGAAAISVMKYGQDLANTPTGYSKVANFDGKAFGK